MADNFSNRAYDLVTNQKEQLHAKTAHFSSVAQSCPTLCDPMNCSMPGLPLHQLPEFTQTHIHRVRDAIQPSYPRSSPSPSAPNPSQHHSLLRWVNSLMRWPKYWSLSFSIITSKEHPGLSSFRMDWLGLLAVQGTLKSHILSCLQTFLKCLSMIDCLPTVTYLLSS